MLLVENDPFLLRSLTESLTNAGYDVIPFSRFEPAKQYLKTATPDVIVTEMRLGAYNGLHLIVLARMERPDITSLVLTSFDDPVLRAEAANLAARYVLKPCSADEVLAGIDC